MRTCRLYSHLRTMSLNAETCIALQLRYNIGKRRRSSNVTNFRTGTLFIAVILSWAHFKANDR